MGNLFGKVLVKGKKAIDNINEATGDVTSVLKEQAKNASKYAKTLIAISMLKAEIEDLYKELGEVVFEEGLMPDNTEALDIMTTLFEKTEMLEHFEREVKVANKEEEDIWDDFPTFEDYFGNSEFSSGEGYFGSCGCSCGEEEDSDCVGCESCTCDCEEELDDEEEVKEEEIKENN